MSNIEWTDETWNPTVGCAKVAEGCRNCYAEKMSKRLAAMGQTAYAEILDDQGRFNGKAITRPDALDKPLRWRKPRMVFVNSMSDLFHEDIPFEFIAAVYGVMAACPRHTFQVLTKRPERMREFFEYIEQRAEMAKEVFPKDTHEWRREHLFSAQCLIHGLGETHKHRGVEFHWPLPNVWHGVSVAEQKDAERFVLPLLNTPSVMHFVSYEPAVGSVDYRNIRIPGTGSETGKEAILDALGGWLRTENDTWPQGAKIDWLIIGGESGPWARPFDIAWARKALKQCAELDFLKTERTPAFVKQLGSHPRLPFYDDNDDREIALSRVHTIYEHGREWDEHHQPDAADGATLIEWKPDSPRGGDPAEWPEDLRVREYPEAKS